MPRGRACKENRYALFGHSRRVGVRLLKIIVTNYSARCLEYSLLIREKQGKLPREARAKFSQGYGSVYGQQRPALKKTCGTPPTLPIPLMRGTPLILFLFNVIGEQTSSRFRTVESMKALRSIPGARNMKRTDATNASGPRRIPNPRCAEPIKARSRPRRGGAAQSICPIPGCPDCHSIVGIRRSIYFGLRALSTTTTDRGALNDLDALFLITRWKPHHISDPKHDIWTAAFGAEALPGPHRG